jgi:hypothetical protein
MVVQRNEIAGTAADVSAPAAGGGSSGMRRLS